MAEEAQAVALPVAEVGKCYSPALSGHARCAYHRHCDPKKKLPTRCVHPQIGRELTAEEIRSMECPFYTPNTPQNVELIEQYKVVAAATGATVEVSNKAGRAAWEAALGVQDDVRVGRELLKRRDGATAPALLVPKLPFKYIDNSNNEQGSVLEFIARVVNDNEIAVLIGHLGSGKTTGVLEVASRVGAPTVVINCDGQLTVDQVIGSRVPGIDENGNTRLEWRDAPLLQAYRSGYWAVIDDYTFTGSDVFSAIFGLMTQDRYQVLSTGEIITRHPEFRLFLTTNPPEYVELYPNRQQTDAAFLSRIQARYWVDYLSEPEERKAMHNAAPMLSKDMLDRMQRVIRVSREYMKNGNLNFAFSTRHAVAWARKIARLGDFMKAAWETFLADMDSESRQVMIDKILDSQVE